MPEHIIYSSPEPKAHIFSPPPSTSSNTKPPNDSKPNKSSFGIRHYYDFNVLTQPKFLREAPLHPPQSVQRRVAHSSLDHHTLGAPFIAASYAIGGVCPRPSPVPTADPKGHGFSRAIKTPRRRRLPLCRGRSVGRRPKRLNCLPVRRRRPLRLNGGWPAHPLATHFGCPIHRSIHCDKWGIPPQVSASHLFFLPGSGPRSTLPPSRH